MHRFRKGVITLACLAALGAASAFAQGTISIPNYRDQNGWHVGGLLEILPSGAFRLDTGAKTATAVSGAATLNKLSGKITSESLTTAAGTFYTLTLTNSKVTASDIVLDSLSNGTNTAGSPGVVRVTPGAGTITFTIRNGDASAALNGTVVVSYAILKN